MAMHTNTPPTQETIVIGCGLLKTKKEIVTKKGDRMAFVQLEDAASGAAEIIVFPKTFAKVEQWLNTYQVFCVKGSLDLTSTQKCKIIANDFIPLDLFFQEWPHIQKVALGLPAHFQETTLTEIKDSIVRGNTPFEIIFEENGKKLQLISEMKVQLEPEALHTLEKRGVAVNLQI